MAIIFEIINSIRNALYKADNSLIFHTGDIKYTGFPFVLLKVKNVNISACAVKKRMEYALGFELLFRKSQDNKINELIEFQKVLKEALLPVINVLDVKITVDNPVFSISEKDLIMNFSLNFYAEEEETAETMQLLDITLKGE